MKRIDLIKISHNVKMGQECPFIEPNILEDCVFYEDGIAVGFYIKKMPKKMCKLADLADNLLRTKDVPKSEMKRAPTDGVDEKTGKYKYKNVVLQYSTIIGSIPPKPHMKRDYAGRSSVHGVKSAQPFIKTMLLLANESEILIKEILPEQHKAQLKLFEQVDQKWRFGNIFIQQWRICNKGH